MPVRRVPVLTLLMMVGAGAGFAQTPPAVAPASAAPAAAAPSATAPAAAATEKKPDAVEPQGFTYNPEGRRDPFVSLMRRGVDTGSTTTRAAGLAGLSTSEVNLRGTIRTQGSFVGILEGVDKKTYIVRAGDKLSDGSIRSITADTMVILQQVNDPLSLEKQHEVRKLLRQSEEGK
jgi:Tfp pilus assembly protein PilP